MKSLLNFRNKKAAYILIFFVLIAAGLHAINIHFPCINSDEASFAYNAYSILKTGKDEYGVTMPSRFKAFGENKLPVTIYSIVPFLAVFGLNDVSSRLPFILLGVLSPILYYFVTKELFGNKKIALVAAFLSCLSPWIQILSRHIHEAIIIMHLGALSMMILSKLMKKYELRWVIWLAVLNGIGLFTYHIAKVFMVFFGLWLIGILYFDKKRSMSIIGKSLIIFLIPVVLFFTTEFLAPTNRVSNLLFINNQGFSLTIDEQMREHPMRLIHNKLNYAMQVLTKQYISYFSPEFLVINGDANKRFGFPGISPISIVEYLFLFIGLYYLFHNKERSRWLLVSTLLFAPISAALTWQEYSITRSFFMIVPILMIASYGMYYAVKSVENNIFRLLVGLLIIGAFGYYSFFTWDFYFEHYPKRTEAIYGWQCGYQELSKYIDQNYDRTDTFYITKKLGQPYIFTLFYRAYPPEKYQKEAQLSKLDEYGFGQVEKYDKFEFHFATPDPKKNAVYVGYPDDFQGSTIPEKDIQKIKIYNDEVFWIYKSNK
ncbi:hypothetical protein BH09PAT2_BH09PAT2_03740 [soil metagenome]